MHIVKWHKEQLFYSREDEGCLFLSLGHPVKSPPEKESLGKPSLISVTLSPSFQPKIMVKVLSKTPTLLTEQDLPTIEALSF